MGCDPQRWAAGRWPSVQMLVSANGYLFIHDNGNNNNIGCVVILRPVVLVEYIPEVDLMLAQLATVCDAGLTSNQHIFLV